MKHTIHQIPEKYAYEQLLLDRRKDLLLREYKWKVDIVLSVLNKELWTEYTSLWETATHHTREYVDNFNN